MTLNKSSTVGIVGAGIMGRLLAWRFLQRGCQVSLFDRDPILKGSAAAYTAAGMLAPYSELESSEHEVYELGLKSLNIWPQLIQELDANDAFKQEGTLVVAHQQDRLELESFRTILTRKLPDVNEIRYVDNTGLFSVEPELSKEFNEAIYLKNESWVYPDKIMTCLAKTILKHNVVWHEKTHVDVVNPGLVRTNKHTCDFDYVIDCRGLGAKGSIKNLRGVRGELIRIYAPDVRLKHMVRLMHPRYKLYLVPQDNHYYILGATQIESEDASPMSVRSAMELLSALYVIHSGFSEARIVDMRTNCRPACLDNLPHVKCIDNRLVQINGLFRHGYLLAPALAQNVMAFFD